MAVSRKKRQRKVELKKAKRKARRNVLVKQSVVGFVERLALAPEAPLLHCLVSEDLEETGIGQVLVSRRLPDGYVAFSNFLIDVYCLGVKDSYTRVASPGEYSDRFDKWIDQQAERINPADARKLIEDAVEYARGIGFSPQGSYRKGMAIFRDIDAGEATRQFEFGKDGEPFYINGPRESQQEMERIYKTLELHCGPGGYQTILVLRDFGEEF